MAALLLDGQVDLRMRVPQGHGRHRARQRQIRARDRVAAASREIERAAELRPSDPVINDHLGDVYWKTGRKLEAKFQWNHARDLKPEPEDLPNILRKIERGLDEPPSANAGDQGAPAEQTKKDGG